MTDLKKLLEPTKKIFSGDASRDMWDEINNLGASHTCEDVRAVLYGICCQIQKLEAKYDKALKALEE